MQQWGWEMGQPLLSPNAVSGITAPLHVPANTGRHGLGYVSLLGGGSASKAPASCAHGIGGGKFVRAGGVGAGEADRSHCQGSAQVQVHGCCNAVASIDPLAEHELFQHFVALQADANQAESGNTVVDVWGDASVLQYLRSGTWSADAEPRERDRIRKRAARYCLVDDQLWRVMVDGSRRVVPPPSERTDIIMSTHERTGHFGVKRTKHLLYAGYWWPGLEADVGRVLATCEVCARIKASFNADRPELQPLSIEGLFYRWGVDLAGPFAKSADGNEYVMVCVEYFSKQIELIPLPEKSARCTANAFLSSVIGRYGACAEVVTDQGTEFQGEFHALLAHCFIDHRTTSANHPQADGLAERCVQTVKRALAKYVAEKQQLTDWDVQLNWIALGYRTSRQASTGLSPYQLLYGAEPVIPPAIRERVEQPVLEFGDPEKCVDYILQRAELLRENCAIAMQNLRVAQQRDAQRYQHVRSGFYQPSGVKFSVGDFVYVRRRVIVDSLQSEARPGIYRVCEVRPSGVLVVQGRDGVTMQVNMAECAPCHLTNINPVLDPELQKVAADFPCNVCGEPDDEDVMLICDGCFKGFHIYCLQPPLATVPSEDIWLCSGCVSAGVTEAAVWALRQQSMPVTASDAALFPTAQQREHDRLALQLDGKKVVMDGRGGSAAVNGQLVYIPRVDRILHPRSPLRLDVPGREPVYVSYRKAVKLVEQSPAVELGTHMGGMSLSSGMTVGQQSVVTSELVGKSWDLTSAAGVKQAFIVVWGGEPSAAVL